MASVKNIVIFCTILILFSSFVAAVPPVTTVFAGNVGFDIEYPSFSTIKQDRFFEFEIHVYNLSNGMPVIGGIECYFHLYNTNGTHLLELSDNTISHQFDYSFKVGGGNFTGLQTCNYVIQCNSSTEGGFVSSFVTVTRSGKEEPALSGSLVLGIILIPLFICFFLLAFSWFLPIEKYWALKLVLPLSGMFLIFQSYQYAIMSLAKYNSTSYLINAIGDNSYIYGWVVWIIITIFLITFIYDIFMMFSGKNKDKTGEEYE